jgi:hypothetical protein
MILEILNPIFGYTKGLRWTLTMNSRPNLFTEYLHVRTLKIKVSHLRLWQGSPLEALIQVGGRNIFLFIMLDAEPRMQDKASKNTLFLKTF